MQFRCENTAKSLVISLLDYKYSGSTVLFIILSITIFFGKRAYNLIISLCFLIALIIYRQYSTYAQPFATATTMSCNTLNFHFD